MSLQEKAKSLNSGKGIDFMSNREKGDMEELIGKVCTIRDYAFISNDDGEYAVFIIEENDKKFYFGGMVLTSNLKAFTDEEHTEIKEEGLPCLFTKQSNKKGKREYVNVEFYPETEDDLPF